jgi:CcmD family protein
VSWSQGELVAAAYGVVFVFVLVYVVIIAAKLARLQRETAELLELVRRPEQTDEPASGVTWEAPEKA